MDTIKVEHTPTKSTIYVHGGRCALGVFHYYTLQGEPLPEPTLPEDWVVKDGKVWKDGLVAVVEDWSEVPTDPELVRKNQWRLTWVKPGTRYTIVCLDGDEQIYQLVTEEDLKNVA